MKKQIIAALALGLASTVSMAQDDKKQVETSAQLDKMLVPVALQAQAETIAQSRMDDAIDRLNAKCDQDMDERLNAIVASADF